MNKDITPETHFGMRIASWAVLVIFMGTTFIGVGTILSEQAQASTRLIKVEDKIDVLIEKTSTDVTTIKEDIAEIKGMLRERR